MRIRRSRSEIESYLALREREGLSFAELSRRTGVRATTLTWWSWRLRKEGRSQFVEAEMERGVASSSSAGIEIETRSGLRVVLAREFDEDTLRRLLAVVSQQC